MSRMRIGIDRSDTKKLYNREEVECDLPFQIGNFHGAIVRLEELSFEYTKTQADRIRAMNNEELRDFLYDVSCNATKITTCEKECADCDKTNDECKAGVTDWLLSEVDDGM